MSLAVIGLGKLLGKASGDDLKGDLRWLVVTPGLSVARM